MPITGVEKVMFAFYVAHYQQQFSNSFCISSMYRLCIEPGNRYSQIMTATHHYFCCLIETRLKITDDRRQRSLSSYIRRS